jgi:hypothetical protein
MDEAGFILTVVNPALWLHLGHFSSTTARSRVTSFTAPYLVPSGFRGSIPNLNRNVSESLHRSTVFWFRAVARGKGNGARGEGIKSVTSWIVLNNGDGCVAATLSEKLEPTTRRATSGVGERLRRRRRWRRRRREGTAARRGQLSRSSRWRWRGGAGGSVASRPVTERGHRRRLDRWARWEAL